MSVDLTMYGEASRNHPQRQDGWRRAALFELEHPRVDGVRWIPWETIRVDARISPRGTTSKIVDRYPETFIALPEVLVQRLTFTMIALKTGWADILAVPSGSS